MKFNLNPNGLPRKLAALAIGASAAVLGATVLAVTVSTRRTERAHPPAGRSLRISGTNLYYFDEGTGPPLVFIHGNVVSAQDFVASGLVASLMKRYRVIVFDRPGFGYSERPRDVDWTPMRQAELLSSALAELEVREPIVVAHSFGCLVAVALALAHPQALTGLVLLSGYYYPSTLLGVPLFALPASPVVGDALRFTALPVFARLMAPLVAKQLFAPAKVTGTFAGYPLSMSRRPSQIRATIEDANALEPAAKVMKGHYGEIAIPVEVLAGDGDMVVNTWSQSERLSRALQDARFTVVRGAGHMVHYIAPDRVLEAIDRISTRAHSRAPRLAS